MDNLPPRIRGRAGTGDDGKFYYEISVWEFNGEKQLNEPLTVGPFDTEEQAKEAGMKTVREVCIAFGGDANRYLDMKNGGILRPWENQ